ncbi:MAG: hypothetical protein QOI51_2576 [Nocardioidaceae bacterium]|jgi:hypothetical protein|nr:hypothetical protein [Nocardioidaceae bacterium]MDX6309690.1 hypothetical protein [Nocardioidaceae bacterium]
MDPKETLRKRFERTPAEEAEAGEDSALAPEVGEGEDLSSAQNAEALRQDPDEVPNRIQAPSPPNEEHVQPGGHVTQE